MARARRPGAISFYAFGIKRTLSCGDLAVFLGIYTHDFALSIDFQHLPLDFPSHMTPSAYWKTLNIGTNPDSKRASLLKNPAHRYIHALLTRTIAGRADSTSVVTRSDLLLLYSIVERLPIHLGYIMADLISHQGHYPRLAKIFTGPYITRLIRGMGLIDRTQGMQVAGGTISLRLTTLCSMGLVSVRNGVYFIVRPDQSSSDESSGDASESDEAPRPPSNFNARLQGLERSMQVLQQDQRHILNVQQQMYTEMREMFAYIRRSYSGPQHDSAAATSHAPTIPPTKPPSS